MPQSITFDETPSDWRVPGTYVEIRPTYGRIGIVDYPTKVLLVGQATTASTGPRNVPVLATRDDDASSRFGAGSQIDAMLRMFRRANLTSQVWIMGQADPVGGVAATGTIVLTGSPSASGQFSVNIAGRRVSIPVAASATVTAITAALAVAVNAITLLPVTATASTGTLTLTSKHTGVLGNDIDIRLNPLAGDVTPAGLTAAVTAMASGAGVPDVAVSLAAIAATWFTDFAFGASDAASAALIEAELATRYRANGRMDGHAYFGLRGTHGELTALGAARNSPYRSGIGAKAAGSPPWEWAASLCARGAFYLAQDPARQMRSLTLPGIVGPAPANLFTPAEQHLLLLDGISTFDVQADGTVALSRVITTYQTNSLGAADDAWLDIMVPRTMSRIRYDWWTYVTLNYPRHKLTDDDSPAAEASDSVVTPRQMHGSWAGRCKLYERLGWIEDVKRTLAESLFQRDPDNRNRMQSRKRARIIGNLMQMFDALEFEA
ncbi:phage tail sheath subtilisin-like domain-containing protein [Humitalea sp. 24SJ18S-53]|uniref:phage tail sheath subtilisin-like domain-containing protein n=1 Tax=Humitalea sp. 24SJ18S-53 TaxID=3422307 RepID=UPI003D67B1F1